MVYQHCVYPACQLGGYNYISAIGLIDSVPETFSSLLTVTLHEIKLIFIEIISIIFLITDEKKL